VPRTSAERRGKRTDDSRPRVESASSVRTGAVVGQLHREPTNLMRPADDEDQVSREVDSRSLSTPASGLGCCCYSQPNTELRRPVWHCQAPTLEQGWSRASGFRGRHDLCPPFASRWDSGCLRQGDGRVLIRRAGARTVRPVQAAAAIQGHRPSTGTLGGAAHFRAHARCPLRTCAGHSTKSPSSLGHGWARCPSVPTASPKS